MKYVETWKQCGKGVQTAVEAKTGDIRLMFDAVGTDYWMSMSNNGSFAAIWSVEVAKAVRNALTSALADRERQDKEEADFEAFQTARQDNLRQVLTTGAELESLKVADSAPPLVAAMAEGEPTVVMTADEYAQLRKGAVEYMDAESVNLAFADVGGES